MSKNKGAELTAKFQKNYLKHALNCDYWHYIYTNAHLYSSEDDSTYINFMRLRDSFGEYVADPGDQRDILNAWHQRALTGQTKFDLNTLNDEVRDLSLEIYIACGKYGYCPSDLAQYIHPEAIINYMLENDGEIPLPPYPLPFDPEQNMRCIILRFSNGMMFDGDLESVKGFIASHPMEPPQNPLSEGYNAKNDDIQIRINKLNRLILFSMVQGESISEELKQEYAKLKKDLSDEQYGTSGNLARAIGLLLWHDANSKHNGNSERAVSEFKKSQLYSEINETLEFQGTTAKYLSDKENSVLYRWIEKTGKCVAERKVLSLK